MPKKHKSKAQWQQRQQQDPYVKAAKAAGYRSRASYKLLQIQEKFGLLKPGLRAIDCGAAPGGWSQIAVKQLGKGNVFAIDLLPFTPLEGVWQHQGDMTLDEDWRILMEAANGPVDIMMSDMAPNMTGNASTDQARMFYLAEMVLDRLPESLKPGGCLIIKAFQGGDIMGFDKAVRGLFQQVKRYKPDASRNESAEIYLVATSYLGSSHAIIDK